MTKLVLIPHPDNRNIHYNSNQIVKIVKETGGIYWFHFTNGDIIRISDIDVINKVRETSDIRF
jgi:hypothetical protein